jgi:hypothetical protein
MALARRHDAAAQTKYQEVKQLAYAQARVLSGTPGTLKQRTKAGNRYWVREYIRADGKKTDEHVGSVNTTSVDGITREIDLARQLASGSASLRLFGYQRIDRKPAAVLEVLFNRRLMEGGLVIVGSHAYGVLLNELGISAAGYKTRDIDVARPHVLSIGLPPEFSFQALLHESGLQFVPVPGMPSDRPSASFKLPGAEALAVDLLVPGKKIGEIIRVKELNAYAQAIPFLEFLIEGPVDAIALSPNQVIPIRVPSPERFALHKLFSSQSRRTDRDKIRKDLDQAAILAAAVEEETPGRLREAFRRMPADAKSSVRKGAAAAAKLLERTHPEAFAALGKIAAK